MRKYFILTIHSTEESDDLLGSLGGASNHVPIKFRNFTKKIILHKTLFLLTKLTQKISIETKNEIQKLKIKTIKGRIYEMNRRQSN